MLNGITLSLHDRIFWVPVYTLARQDSNLDFQDQNLRCYRYTTG